MTAFGTLWSHRLFFKFLRGQKQCLLSQGKVPWKSLCTTPIARQALESNSEKASDKNKRPRKKTRSTIELQSLPQGLLVSPKTEHVVKKDPVQYPTVFQQVRNNMRKYDDCVVITRLGNFYELYFEQAQEYGPLLNLKVSRRKTSAGDIPMSGFQYQYLLKYLRILVMDLHKHVAIFDEVPLEPADRAKSGGLMHDRKIKRVVTAGTLVDEDLLDPNKSNFLLSIHLGTDGIHQKLGLAWLDLSSSNFFVQSVNITSLTSALAKISPSEVVLASSLKETNQGLQAISILKDARCEITWHHISEGDLSSSSWISLLERPLTERELKEYSPDEVAAAKMALHYVQERLQISDARLQPPIRQSNHLSIDRYSLKALEIKTTLRDGFFKGSLLHVLQNTVTKSGSKMLTNNLIWPSLDLSVINSRLDLVETLVKSSSFRKDIQDLLGLTLDASRLLTKFALGLAEADDLLGLSKTIGVMVDIVQCIQNFSQDMTDPNKNITIQNLNAVLDILARVDLEKPKALADQIANAMDEEGLSENQFPETSEVDLTTLEEQNQILSNNSTSAPKSEHALAIVANSSRARSQMELWDEPWIMKRNASTNLERLHHILDQLWQEQDCLAKELQQKLGVPNIGLKLSSTLGYFCHLKHKSSTKLVDKLEDARLVGSSKSTASFHYPGWTQLGERIEAVRIQIRTEEQKVFSRLCKEVEKHIARLRRNAKILDELDVACSHATVAKMQNWTRPILNNSTSHTIIGGRHPMVDLGLREKGVGFTANDCHLHAREQILFITGPNMAGKSTFLRQNALIAILAQTGSFVPAIYAEIGLVDKVFSRVGSADNLSRDQSTFMVEMLESAEILKNATERSFVIMDEVGRGTTPEDGIALGFACLDHLARVNRCRALFATHFHLLADLTRGFGNVGYYCTDVVKAGDGYSYLHRLRQGVNRESHALKVAELAGLPKEAIETARGVLQQLDSGEVHGLPRTRIATQEAPNLNQIVGSQTVDTTK